MFGSTDSLKRFNSNKLQIYKSFLLSSKAGVKIFCKWLKFHFDPHKIAICKHFENSVQYMQTAFMTHLLQFIGLTFSIPIQSSDGN